VAVPHEPLDGRQVFARGEHRRGIGAAEVVRAERLEPRLKRGLAEYMPDAARRHLEDTRVRVRSVWWVPRTDAAQHLVGNRDVALLAPFAQHRHVVDLDVTEA